MKRGRPLALIATALLLILIPDASPAQARPSADGDCGISGCADFGDGAIVVGDVENAPGGGKIALNAPDPLLEWRLSNSCIDEDGSIGGCTPQPSCPAPPDRVVHNFLVQFRAIADGPMALWDNDGVHCVDITDLEPVVTPAMVQAEFEQLPLPLGEISAQPPDGTVLVNMGVILYTTQPDRVPYDVDILGQLVHIDAYITDYAWHLGDGSPDLHGRGAPYPDKTTLHVYTAPGPYEVTLTLTWDATYTVDGGPEQQIPDTTTTDSPPTPLTVVEAESILVDQFD